MSSRRLAYASVTALVLIAALVAGMSLRDPGIPATSPSPSPSPTAAADAAASATPTATTGATATAAASPSPTPAATAGVLDERFGFYVLKQRPNGRDDGVLRSETGESELGSFVPLDRSFVSLSRAVSPDGRFVAYWGPVRDGAVLRVRAVKDGSTRALFTAASEMSGGNFAWSSDGFGLVFALDNNMFGPGGGSALAEIWTLDLASGASRKIASRTDAAVWLPVAWDRTGNIVGAGLSGEGGYLFGFDLLDLSKDPPTQRTYPTSERSFGPFAFAMRASPDARYVLAAQSDQPISWWPVADPSKRSTIEYDGIRAEWRPGTSELWWVGGLSPAGCGAGTCTGAELVSFDVATGQRTVVRGRFGGHLLGFRIDGSAAITASLASSFPEASGTMDVTIVDIATGRTEELRVSGEVRASIRLD